MDNILLFRIMMLGLIAATFAWFFYQNHKIDEKLKEIDTKH